ncbi:MAG: hypothetical protein CSA35_09495 [Dethiosulfovibrio peptidovorans]|nr:MAG: hypothetical protein CSA35_09495 [Dethiosulfovibrio peptidovorans]
MNKIQIVVLAFVVCLFATSLSAAPRPRDNSQSLVLQEAWRAGRQMVESGMYIRGVTFLKAYLHQQPQSPDGWYWLGKAYQGMGHLREAQMAFTTTLAVDPHYPPLSRVLQNRATGEAVALWDPAGLTFTHGLPVIVPTRCDHHGHLPGQCIHRYNARAYAAPLEYVTQPKSTASSPKNTVRPQPVLTPRTVTGMSPLGAKKVLVHPGQKFNPVVPIPPVRNITGEPEGPGIPTIQGPSPNAPSGSVPMTVAPTAPAPAASTPQPVPVYIPPAPQQKTSH